MNNEQSTMNNPSPPTHLLIPLKLSTSSLPAPIAYTLANKIQFLPTTQIPAQTKVPDPTLQFAIRFLEKSLSDGPVRSLTLTDHAKQNNISRSTLARARESLGVQALKQAWSNRWFWQLPHETRPLPEDPLEKRFFELAKSLATSLQNDATDNLDDDTEPDEYKQHEGEEQEEEDQDEESTTQRVRRPHESLPEKNPSSPPTHESLPGETPCSAKNPESLPSKTPPGEPVASAPVTHPLLPTGTPPRTRPHNPSPI